MVGVNNPQQGGCPINPSPCLKEKVWRPAHHAPVTPEWSGNWKMASTMIDETRRSTS